EREAEFKIVVKSVLDSRSDGTFCVRPETLHCLRKDVGCGVAERLLPHIVRECQVLDRPVFHAHFHSLSSPFSAFIQTAIRGLFSKTKTPLPGLLLRPPQGCNSLHGSTF